MMSRPTGLVKRVECELKKAPATALEIADELEGWSLERVRRALRYLRLNGRARVAGRKPEREDNHALSTIYAYVPLIERRVREYARGRNLGGHVA